MYFLYCSGILIYYALIRVSALFNQKARKWLRGREGILDQLEKLNLSSDKIIWFHCASLGEFEQGRPVIEAIKKANRDYKILLTFFSPSGYEVRKNWPFADHVFYLPLDTKWNAKKFISLCNPQLVVFVKYEFWYHYINELNERKIPLFIISAIFRENQHFFKHYGNWWRNLLKKISHIYVQDQKSLQLLNTMGVKNASVAGDTRFDRVYQSASNPVPVMEVENFCSKIPVLIAGSTWAEDEKLIIKFIRNYPGEMKFIIAPHEVHKKRINQLESLLKGVKTVKFSCIKSSKAESAKVLIIDNIGYLSKLYAYGKVAYIGGGFGKGIHNILEAAAFGLPVVFGPNYHKFKEARELIGEGGAFCVKNEDEFNNAMVKVLSVYTPKICANYVNKNKGATDIITEALLKYVEGTGINREQ